MDEEVVYVVFGIVSWFIKVVAKTMLLTLGDNGVVVIVAGILVIELNYFT